MKTFLVRNQEYTTIKTNYNQFISYTSKGTYEKGLMRIEPFQQIKITVMGFPYPDEIEVMVEKYCEKDNKKIVTFGIMQKNELIKILGLD